MHAVLAQSTDRQDRQQASKGFSPLPQLPNHSTHGTLGGELSSSRSSALVVVIAAGGKLGEPAGTRAHPLERLGCGGRWPQTRGGVLAAQVEESERESAADLGEGGVRLVTRMQTCML